MSEITQSLHSPAAAPAWSKIQASHPRLSDAENDPQKFLHSSFYVPSGDEQIINLAKILTKNSKSEVESIQRIHDFVALHITFGTDAPNYAQLQEICRREADTNIYQGCAWRDALSSLKSGIGHCGSYSTLAAALLRAVGIPAAVMLVSKEGRQKYFEIFHTQILHQWTAVYINGQWVHLDITWDDNRVGPISHEYFLFFPDDLPNDDQIHRYYNFIND